MLGRVICDKVGSIVVVLVLCLLPLGTSPECGADTVDKSALSQDLNKIATIGYVTWWSHDAVGYHPAIWIKVENVSGSDLSGVIIRFQGRFTDLRNGYVTVARKEIRSDFASHQQIQIPLRGPTPFELPIDENAWPSIECKAMCRIGEVGDEGTQDLLICRLDPITMTDEEALSQLTKQTGVGRVANTGAMRGDFDQVRRRKRDAVEHTIVAPTKALLATAGNLLGAPASSNTKEHKKLREQGADLSIPLKMSELVKMPGLGDDFYNFEKYFGVPGNTDIVASKSDLTWVSYPGKGCFSNVWVASRAMSGKADLIVITLPIIVDAKEPQLLALAKILAQKGKSSTPNSFAHSVRYLPTGRSEIARLNQPDYRAVSFKTAGNVSSEAKTVLAVSRLASDLEGTLASSAKRIGMLAPIAKGLAADEN